MTHIAETQPNISRHRDKDSEVDFGQNTKSREKTNTMEYLKHSSVRVTKKENGI